jgi:hypothetical protein
MSYNSQQFRSVITEVLDLYGQPTAKLYSPAAVELLLGTAAVESAFGKYLYQIHGPAKGAFQVEPATFDWLRERYKGRYKMLDDAAGADDLMWNLVLSILVARLRYYVVPETLPAADDIPAQASYWKRHYNTHKGSGTVEGYLAAYDKYVQGDSEIIQRRFPLAYKRLTRVFERGEESHPEGFASDTVEFEISRASEHLACRTAGEVHDPVVTDETNLEHAAARLIMAVELEERKK